MNVAILEIAPPSFIVADLINRIYNPWLAEKLGQPLNVSAFVTMGGGVLFRR